MDNLEITGALTPSTLINDSSDTSDSSTALLILDVSAADIEAGLLDNAEVVTFIVNSTNPDLYQHVLRSGWIGNVTRTAEGKYTTELRGLTQALSQGICRTYGIGCDAELSDSRCRVDMAAHTFTDSVTTVYSRREFATSTFLGLTQTVGGTITFTSGLNTGYSMEIKSYSIPLALHMVLYLPMPNDITSGDTFIFRRGCDKQRSTCIDVYDNILNYRGHGTFVPGDTEVLKVGKGG